MQTRNLIVNVSRNGERHRRIAWGIMHPDDGRIDFSASTETVPDEVLDEFNRYLSEFRVSEGTWHHTSGETDYEFIFRQA